MNKKFIEKEKINNNGFAVAGVVYSILLLFIILLTSLLVMLGNRKRVLDSLNKDVVSNMNDSASLRITFDHRDVLVTNTSHVYDFQFDLLEGVHLTYLGKDVDASSVSYTSKPTFDSTKSGDYVITYTAIYNGITTTEKRLVSVVDSSPFTYEFTGAPQNFIAPSDGLYSIELWGAQGYFANGTAGKGAYTRGQIELQEKETLFVHVGQGLMNESGALTYNGGRGNHGGWPGGGATDIRLSTGSWNVFDSLKSRIMVAAGSGAAGGSTSAVAGSGGTLTGIAGGGTQGGTQTTFGAPQTSDYSGSRFGVANGGCTGGNGYYPGGGAACANGSGGGSSFISGYTGCNAIASSSVQGAVVHTGQPNHYSGKIFKNSVMIAGNGSMPNHEGTGTMTGNSGHGYAKITPLVVPASTILLKANPVTVVNQSKVANFTFDPLYGVELVGKNGKKISASEITYVSNPTFDGTKNGTYTFTYTTIYEGNTYKVDRVVEVVDPKPILFPYKNSSIQSFTTESSGVYSIELWGAQGAYGSGGTAGKGAYTKGEIDLIKGETLYVFVGEGLNKTNNGTSFNGGTANSGGWPGGGATDVRLYYANWNNFDGLKSRIMVAAGSGSVNASAGKAGSGGTLTGIAGGGTQGGTQTSMASSSSTSFTASSFGVANGGCAGGNGYYPGGGSACATGSGGGSSYISGHPGCNAVTSTSGLTTTIVHTGQPNHYSGKVFKNTVMLSGDSLMPNHEGTGTMTGNTGHGYAKITPVVLEV